MLLDFFISLPVDPLTITLTGATQGARVLDTAMILIIQANDAPIRFQQVGHMIRNCFEMDLIIQICDVIVSLKTKLNHR
jgi:hypothetical protein